MEQNRQISEVVAMLATMQATLTKNVVVLKELAWWKPAVELKIGDLRTTVDELRSKIEHEHKVFDIEFVDTVKPDTTHLVSSSPEAASGQIGHHSETSYRGTPHGVVYTTVTPPVKVNRFIVGLKHEIKVVVLIQKPKDLDAASSLALLQEELSGDCTKRSAVGQTTPRNAGQSYTSEKKQQEGPKSANSGGPSNDKASAIRAYRRAMGQCYKCGLKWNPSHQCASTVPTHMVEELWQILQEPAICSNLDNVQTESYPESPECESAEDLMAISLHAVDGREAPKTIKLMGKILGKHPLVLIDSGSTSNFVSERFASYIPSWSELVKPVQVKVANGAIVLCTHYIPSCQLTINCHQFTVDLRSLSVMPLKCYDVVLGMEWLESFSPIEVHLSQKWLSFLHSGSKIKLQGLTEGCENLSEISMSELLSCERSHSHSIPLLPGAQPFRLRPYHYCPAQKDEIERQVAKLLQSDMIKPSNSPYAFPALLVKKKAGEWRLCVDYRRLNAMTVNSRYPMPVIDELLDELASAKWFTTLDLRAGFHQIRMKEEDQHKIAFQTHHGQFEYRVMPYGVTGGPGTFQAVMNHTLAPFLRKGVLVFIDDILVYSINWDKHMELLRSVFQLLLGNQFKIKLSKCSFAKLELLYLGHVISAKGVATNPSKIEVVQNWPRPTSVKEVRAFLGLAGYYRKFVRNFGVIARPLTELLKKGKVFFWTEAHEESFNFLKQALVSAPVLALPDFSKTFVVETDASDKGIGAILQQEGHPAAFISEALGIKNQALSTYEKEFLPILMAVEFWRAYLINGEFIFKTEQKSLIHLNDQLLTRH
ncbi:hypothetical protein U9M48_031050 [Paspalum notatum var. saurae]|uniref:Reverse transcriptase domain-containing protein n=1 Tax=Paspalum notatum var. saurae TaxID=547442 RepID=A0AAQ3U487_PASNO